MKKLILFILLFMVVFSCSEETPPPFYEVIPVIEVTNPFFDDIKYVRLQNTLTVNGVATTKIWDTQFSGARRSCTLLKWQGEAIEYVVGTVLEFKVNVFYNVENNGFVLVENFSNDFLPKRATWIRVYFEVRDRNNPSNKFLGIEQYNDPNINIYQTPTVVWTVTDLNTIPSSGGVASKNTNARIINNDTDKECVCIWNEVK